MENYKNLGGSSNVESYDIQAESITVKFKTGANQFYLYDYTKPGELHVEELKSLAISGSGLNSYIGKNLRSAGSFMKKW